MTYRSVVCCQLGNSKASIDSSDDTIDSLFKVDWLIDRTENVDWTLVSVGMSEGLFIKLIISLVMIGVIAEESLSSQVSQH